MKIVVLEHGCADFSFKLTFRCLLIKSFKIIVYLTSSVFNISFKLKSNKVPFLNITYGEISI